MLLNKAKDVMTAQHGRSNRFASVVRVHFQSLIYKIMTKSMRQTSAPRTLAKVYFTGSQLDHRHQPDGGYLSSFSQRKLSMKYEPAVLWYMHMHISATLTTCRSHMLLLFQWLFQVGQCQKWTCQRTNNKRGSRRPRPLNWELSMVEWWCRWQLKRLEFSLTSN